MQGPHIAGCFAFQQNLIFEGSFRPTAHFPSMLKTGYYASSEMTFFGVGHQTDGGRVIRPCAMVRVPEGSSISPPHLCFICLLPWYSLARDNPSHGSVATRFLMTPADSFSTCHASLATSGIRTRDLGFGSKPVNLSCCIIMINSGVIPVEPDEA